MRLRDNSTPPPLRNQRTIEAGKDRKRLWFGVALFVLSIVSCAGAFYGAKKMVVVSDMTFTGAKHLKAEDLKALVRVRKGDELFGVSSSEIRTRLMKSPWVKDAVIRKELTGRIEVYIFEAVPRAVLQTQDRSMLIDRDGVLLEEVKPSAQIVLPILRGIDPVQMRDAYREALAFAEVLQARRGTLTQGDLIISGSRPEELALLIDQVSVRIGSGEFERKLTDLQFVREEIAKRNIRVEYIDLRFANRIVVKPINQDAHESDTSEEKSQKHAKKRR